ncbi:MAG TPA: DNA translocase FtsK 4TM domain-containing protein [Solirubrobacteraceae bacterium]|nr:DNA translocase FtsK 4TM domain-containing protein [Solirubrobacteraceae bacterium]
MAAARKPAPRRPPAGGRPRARARRSSLGALGLPALEQRHLDVIGLGLVAVGVFLAFPLYLGWDGGAAGQAAKDGLAYLVGQVAYAVPVTIAAAGAILVLRPVLPTVRPFRSGALCLFAALTLMLAAGTFGLGPDGVRDGYWEAPFFEARGGIVGDALLYVVATAVSTIGAHILALFLFVAGVLLVTGASVAGVLRATGSGLVDTTRALGRAVPVQPRRARRAQPPPDGDPREQPEPEPHHPPEPAGRAGGAGFWSGAARFPDIYGEPPPEGGPPDDGAAPEAEPDGLRVDEPQPEPGSGSRPHRPRPSTSRRRAGCAARSPTTPGFGGACPARICSSAPPTSSRAPTPPARSEPPTA